MKVGTRSVLFGVHQFFLHPLFVAISWYLVDGKAPSWRAVICIVCHDLGYLGKPDMDGSDGIRHPELGAAIVHRLLGRAWANLALHHSRSYCRLVGADVSALCLPDKLAILLYPNWLYLALARLSGEICEYKRRMSRSALSDAEWLVEMKLTIFLWGQEAVKRDPSRLARLNRIFGPRVGRHPLDLALNKAG